MNLDSRIVIVGGGFAGARLAQDLSASGFNHVCLIDLKAYFEVTYATLRGLVDPDNWGSRSRVEYVDFVRAAFIQASVLRLGRDRVELSDGQNLNFDHAVVAAGSSYDSFRIAKSSTALSLDERRLEVACASEALAKASSVLVVGGGPVGVELTGEIADHFPDKHVTLVHGAPHLLDSLSTRAGLTARRQLEALGVCVRTNLMLQAVATDRYRASTGEVFSADVVYLCGGARPRTAFVDDSVGWPRDEAGRLLVNRHLQLEGSTALYAIGDCANVPELKLGYLADAQASFLAKNFLRSAQGRSMRPYKPHPNMALVPTGRRSGLMQLPFMVTTARSLVDIKQKDFFISREFKALGVDGGQAPGATRK